MTDQSVTRAASLTTVGDVIDLNGLPSRVDAVTTEKGGWRFHLADGRERFAAFDGVVLVRIEQDRPNRPTSPFARWQPTATPSTGTVRDVVGRPCPAAIESSYPLYAACAYCGRGIRCADGTADWHHVSDYRTACRETTR